jgi:hypothetical protein
MGDGPCTHKAEALLFFLLFCFSSLQRGLFYKTKTAALSLSIRSLSLSLFPSRCVRVAKEIKRTAETLPLFSWTATHLSHHFFSSLLLELHHKRKPKRK